jgi:hypothetical protein
MIDTGSSYVEGAPLGSRVTCSPLGTTASIDVVAA